VPEGERARDAALMEQLARRQPGALEQLYDRYARLVYSLALRITAQSAMAEEIVQDVFLQLWRHANLYQASRGALSAWLMTLARNRALDHLRGKQQRQRQREEALDRNPGIAAMPAMESVVDEQRRAECVRSLMASLPAPQRRAIEMAYFEGMTHSEIAAAMKEPLGTVKSWIRNGLLQLREALKGTL
jgi:RNA polymerase sigma-70 factor (ECF subfamily)